MSENIKLKFTGFRNQLMLWNSEENNRKMPWKGEKDPYKIWLSEVILQQTRVEQGLAYYNKFVATYPTVHHLAQAADDAVFKLWEGLGYYSRCKNLLATARIIDKDYKGIFPTVYTDILALKGVGPYTAAAIASFAFNLAHAVVDGNVYRVLARYFGIAMPTDSTEGKKLFTALAGDCLDTKQPGLYNQSIMDFGATVCTPATPLCTTCILANNCAAFKRNLVGVLPIKTKKLVKKSRWFTYFIVETPQGILVRKRTIKDIWQNLHEFYLQEDIAERSWSEILVKKFINKELGICEASVSMSQVYIQKLTHQNVYSRFVSVKTNEIILPPTDYFFQPVTLLNALAFPKTITQFLELSATQVSIF